MLNELAERITLVQTAISDATESKATCRIMARARASRIKKYLHLIPRLLCDEKPCRRIDTICHETKVETVDELIKTYKRPDILKLDVEGHEYKILQGAKSLLQNHKPQIIQYENKDGRVEAEIAELLQTSGYRVGKQRGHDSNTVAVLLQSESSADD